MKVKGKIRPRDAEATKVSILDAAELEFARAGLLGARTENIAETTGVTRAMIHYYYDSKEKLYQSVLERAFSERIRGLQKINIHGADAEEVLADFIRAYMGEQTRNANLPTIMLFEAIQNEGRYYKEIALASMYQPLIDILERGMAEGKFVRLDPRHVAINIVGLCVFYFCARNNVRHLFPAGADLLSDTMRQEHLETSVRMLICGLRNH